MAGSAWTNQIQNTVIVAGPTGTITGFFVYSGTPGPGNSPVGSWTIPGTTKDPFGNSILPDLVVGQTGSGQVQLIPGPPAFISFPIPGTWNAQPRISVATPSSANLQIVSASDTTGLDAVFLSLDSGNAGSGANWFMVYADGLGGSNTHLEGTFAGVQLPVVASMSAVAPGSGTSTTNPATVESWHSMTLVNSWANVAGFVAAKYRLVPSPPNSVEIIGAINAAAASAATFFTLPSAYRPASKQPVCSMGANASVPANLSPWIQCDTSGNLSVQNTGAVPAAWESFFHGFITLDA